MIVGSARRLASGLIGQCDQPAHDLGHAADVLLALVAFAIDGQQAVRLRQLSISVANGCRG